MPGRTVCAKCDRFDNQELLPADSRAVTVRPSRCGGCVRELVFRVYMNARHAVRADLGITVDTADAADAGGLDLHRPATAAEDDPAIGGDVVIGQDVATTLWASNKSPLSLLPSTA